MATSPTTAIRIDKTEIIRGKRHIALLFDYQNQHGLTIDELDTMIDIGRIEFGYVWYNWKTKQFDEWSGDETRDSLYTSIDRMIEITGLPE